MDYPFIGMLQAFGFNWAPRNYALCAGQLVAIQENPSLFSLVSTFYGGDGRVSFGLPSLRGRMAYGFGSLPGGLTYQIGHLHGLEDIVLTEQEMPNHAHGATFTPTGSESTGVEASQTQGTVASPAAGDYVGSGPAFGAAEPLYVPSGSEGTTVSLGGVSATGGGGTVTLAHTGTNDPIDIRQPVLAVNWCIALDGMYPSRN
jgi:microcystin-dependent protein